VRASAKYSAALRMLPYTERRALRQLYRLLLALALMTVPLSGMPALRTSSLILLRTSFVPFDASVESPGPAVFQVSFVGPSSRRIELAPNTISNPIARHQIVSRETTIETRSLSGLTGLPSARSPPRA